MLTFGSLFSGIGGFDKGFEMAGLSCSWQCEIDDKAGAVLARHWPNVKRYKDVRTITGRTGKGWKRYYHLEPVDVICGGFPCQDLSVAGKWAGLAGSRSGLWFEFHRIIKELRPGMVIIENVPGLLSSNGGRDFAVILRGLVELGYGVCWRVLDAQFFGVAQRRRRVFVVASLGTGSAAEVLFEREGLPGDTAPSRETGQGFTAVAGTLSASRGGTERPAGNANELDFCIPVPTVEVCGTLTGGSGKRGWKDDVDNPASFIPMAFQQNTRDEVRFINGDGQIAGALAAQSEAKQTNYIAFGGGNTGGSIEVSTALTTSNQRLDFDHETFLAQSFGVRRLMPLECERLQGFPDGWTEYGALKDPSVLHNFEELAGSILSTIQCKERGLYRQADSNRYHQLGNAVCVNVAYWLGKRIVAAAQTPGEDNQQGG